ncbi:beta strand repeat-containing protein, partial [Vulcanococcus limneticus]|uniref:beta strand repeat-containing protein n=1 Tax=Vulcanococcus limneticus TaxID=2170428 RepID=UPI00398C0205
TYTVSDANLDFLSAGETISFTYTLTATDSQNATASDTVTVTITGTNDDKGIVVGQNISDTQVTQGTTTTADNHAIDNTPGGPDGPIDGTPSADVLIGDVGGATTTVVPGANYNIIIIADTSGSMLWDAATGSSSNVTLSRIDLLKASLTNLVNQLDDHSLTGGKVNISLVNFATDIKPVDLNGNANGTPSSVIDLTTSNSGGVLSAINSLSANGGTNYEAAFIKAASEISTLQASYSSAQGYQTITYFLTDGDPTFRLDEDGDPVSDGSGSQTSASELSEAIGAFAQVSSASAVSAIGIGTSTNIDYLQFFDNTSNPVSKSVTFGSGRDKVTVSGPAATPDIVTTGDQLDAILQGGSTTVTVSPVGNDVINGGSGDDAILGDSIFSTSIDKGWADYISTNTSLTTDIAKADDIYANLTSSNPTYAREGSVGGNDTIDGGAGNDVIFGQGGNDSISGGSGNDTISGGSGNDSISGGSGNDVIRGGTGVDVLSGGTGNDQFVFVRNEGGISAATAEIDVITDFTVNTDTIVINGNGTNISSVSVSAPTGNTYTITVSYTGSVTEYFKVNLTNAAILNDAPGGVSSTVDIAGTSATIDGAIIGATLYIDINRNNQEDTGERLGTTDAKGNVEWVVNLSTLDVNGDGKYTIGEARAVQSGGVDLDTGLTYEINLYGQVGAPVVTPLTSLLQTLLENGVDYASANDTLVANLGLSAGTDLGSLNPIEGSNQVLGQNAAVMTLAVQFSELVAQQLGTDEAHASFSVFEAISTVITGLPDGGVADFSDPSILASIAAELNLKTYSGSSVSSLMEASQQALQYSLSSIGSEDKALASISAVQNLTQGTYAQAIESVQTGDLNEQALLDLANTLHSYTSGVITIEQLGSFNQILGAALGDGVITSTEFQIALQSLPDLGGAAAVTNGFESENISNLAAQFLSNLEVNNTDGTALTSGEIAYELDAAVSAFLIEHNISIDHYQDIQQQVVDQVSQALASQGLVIDSSVLQDPAGPVAGGAVNSALDNPLHGDDISLAALIEQVIAHPELLTPAPAEAAPVAAILPVGSPAEGQPLDLISGADSSHLTPGDNGSDPANGAATDPNHSQDPTHVSDWSDPGLLPALPGSVLDPVQTNAGGQQAQPADSSNTTATPVVESTVLDAPLQQPLADLASVVDTYIADHPVTETQLADIHQEVALTETLTVDPISHDSGGAADLAVHDTGGADSTSHDPTDVAQHDAGLQNTPVVDIGPSSLDPVHHDILT